ncbi:MAG: hypothetical protein IT304_12230 [Dehalococcoidia bacterium]|nr:hypothetical protein [Dehalococcoidia bacterium]
MRTTPVQSSTVNLPTSTARAASASSSHVPRDQVSISDEGRHRAASDPEQVSGPARALHVVHYLAITPLGPFWLELPPDGRRYAHNPLPVEWSSPPSDEVPAPDA